MESGLEDRNNLDEVTGIASSRDSSQWSPA